MGKIALVVDDSPFLRRTVTSFLTFLFGFISPLEASDGKEALDVLSAFDGEVDFILLDLFMPRMDGFEFLTRIRTTPRYSELPVIVLTTSGQDDVKQKAIDCGATAYLKKPFQANQLKKVLEKLKLIE